MLYVVNPKSLKPDKSLDYDMGFSKMDLRWLFNDENSLVTMCAVGHTHKQRYGEHRLHIHKHAEEIIIMLKGSAIEIIGSEEYTIGPGDCVFIPKDVPHSQKSISDEVETIFIYVGSTSLEKTGYELVE